MNLLGKVKKKITQIKSEWITPPESEHKAEGFVQLRTADGKTAITVSLADSKDAHKAKQLVNLALGDVESDDDKPYMLGSVDMD